MSSAFFAYWKVLIIASGISCLTSTARIMESAEHLGKGTYFAWR